MASLAFGYIFCLKNLFSLFWESKSPRYMFFSKPKRDNNLLVYFLSFQYSLALGYIRVQCLCPCYKQAVHLSQYDINYLFQIVTSMHLFCLWPLLICWNYTQLALIVCSMSKSIFTLIICSMLTSENRMIGNALRLRHLHPGLKMAPIATHLRPLVIISHNLIISTLHLVRILAIRSATSPRLDLSETITKWRWLPEEGNFITHARELLIEANNEFDELTRIMLQKPFQCLLHLE